MENKSSKSAPGCIFVASITTKNGEKIYAKDYGKKAFCISADKLKCKKL